MSSINESRLATLDASMADRIPPICGPLFAAKTKSGLTFEQIGAELGRDEIAVAGMFYGQVQASEEDIEKLSHLLGQRKEDLVTLTAFPDRGRAGPMPPVEPLQYRLFEIIQNYGYALKAVLNEKFGDGIMSAIAFKPHVEKEVDENGVTWAVITLRGKWLPFTRF
ncbi:cyanate hydratase [Plectosphaerella plurivora]|uniref:Cyanate hydratase n=1 Tax=Plectosphaerella plurivora TaxID=936078 RepID=A0A9P8V9S4_9PEZI|nr:cyanate hydratase [Plectosphaerella plurivora]